jgi:hypothetical protein
MCEMNLFCRAVLTEGFFLKTGKGASLVDPDPEVKVLYLDLRLRVNFNRNHLTKLII